MAANASKDRQNVLIERLESERTYNKSLHHFYDNFITKLKQKPFSSNAEVKKLFDSIKIIEIIMNISDGLLHEWDEEFKKTKKSDYLSDSDKAAGVTLESKLTQRLSAIYLEYLPFFKTYSSFANSYYEMLDYIKEITNKNVEFKNLCKDFPSLPNSRMLDIEAHLIMPIQRLPRYVLLNSEVLKHTEKTEASYKDTLLGIDRTKVILDNINSRMKYLEENAKCEKAYKSKSKIERESARSVSFELKGENYFNKSHFASQDRDSQKVKADKKKSLGINHGKFVDFLAKKFKDSPSTSITYDNDHKLFVNIAINGEPYTFQVLKGLPESVDYSDKNSQKFHVRIEHDLAVASPEIRAVLYNAARQIGQCIVGSIQNEKTLEALEEIKPVRHPGAIYEGLLKIVAHQNVDNKELLMTAKTPELKYEELVGIEKTKSSDGIVAKDFVLPESKVIDSRGELQADGGFLNKDGNYCYYIQDPETKKEYNYCTLYMDRKFNMWLYQYFDAAGNATKLMLKDKNGLFASIEKVEGKGDIRQTVCYQDVEGKVESIHLCESDDLNGDYVRNITVKSLESLKSKVSESEAARSEVPRVDEILEKFRTYGVVDDVNERTSEALKLIKFSQNKKIKDTVNLLVRNLKLPVNLKGEALKKYVVEKINYAEKQVDSLNLSEVDKKYLKDFLDMNGIRDKAKNKKNDFGEDVEKYYLMTKTFLEKISLALKKTDIIEPLEKDIKFLEDTIKNNPSKIDKENYGEIAKQMKRTVEKMKATKLDLVDTLVRLNNEHNKLFDAVYAFIPVKDQAESSIRDFIKEVSDIKKQAPRGPDKQYYENFLKELKKIKKEIDSCVNLNDVNKLREMHSRLKVLSVEHEMGMKEKSSSLLKVSNIIKKVKKTQKLESNKSNKEFYEKRLKELREEERAMKGKDVASYDWIGKSKQQVEKYDEMKKQIDDKHQLIERITKAIKKFEGTNNQTIRNQDGEEKLLLNLKNLKKLEEKAKKAMPGGAAFEAVRNSFTKNQL